MVDASGDKRASVDDRAQLQAMLLASPVAVAFLDRELRYTRVTPSLAALHGVTLDKAQGANLLALFSDGDAERVRRLLAEVASSATPVTGIELTTKDGPQGRRDLACCFFPVAVGGDLVGIGAILVDDSERRRLGVEARMRTLELEAVLASIPEGVYVGDRGGVRTASRRALEMLGFDTAEDLNRPVDVLMSGLDVRTPDGSPQRPEDNVFLRAMQGESAREEFLLRPRNAKEHIVVRSSAAPIRTGDGVVAAVAVNIDVTERRKIERELRTQRELAVVERDVLAHFAEGKSLEKIIEPLARGLERVCTTGLLASVVILEGDVIREVVAPSLPPAFCRAIEGQRIGPKAGSCGTAAYRRERVVVTDVETDPLWEDYRDIARPFGLRACWSHPICATDGAVLGTVALYYRDTRAPTQAELDAIEGCARVARIALERHRDEAVRRKLVDELRETVHLNEMLVGIVAHDLRSPLQAITTGVALAQDTTDDDHRRRLLDRVQKSAQRMGHMIGQILDLTRVRQAGGLSLSRERSELAAIARTVVAEVELAYPKRQLVVRIAGDTAGEWDAVRMSQVLSNLLCNAMQHGDPARDVELRVVGEPEGVAVRVQNGGVIPPNRLPWIFDAFRRGGGRADRAQGLGLGLFIAKQVVVAHGGRIDVTSSEQEGTRFDILLPRGEQASAAHMPASARAPAGPDLSAS